jgi:biotin-dependent carboxylase-like uncharacterized protein
MSEAFTAIETLAVQGLATVQGHARPGRMHEGVPPGGPMVPELAARANLAAGNAPEAPLLEVFGSVALAIHGSTRRLATEEGSVGSFAPGERFDARPSRELRLRYVAVEGGLDVAEVLGGPGTLLVAGLGGHEGRALRRGDRIAVGNRSRRASFHVEMPDLDSPIRVVLGPDESRFGPEAATRLVHESFTILGASDRTGARLSGPALPRAGEDGMRSAPMVQGAIQVPSSGEPIVLGPDHPTTGGYPVIAVVARVDLGRMFARPVGAKVRFAVVTLDEARALAREAGA